MELLPELNKEATCKRVKKFFTQDLEKLTLLAGQRMVDLQSPTMDGQPKGTSFGNSAENKIVNGLDAQAIVLSVNEALHTGVDETSKKILLGRYINHERWVDVQNVIYKEHTTFGKLQNHALIAFAYSFEGKQRKNNCDKIIDLKVYY
ncbi:MULTISPECIES: ArpU family phage packaging/lysis transcriptional regulator [Lactobacillus]|uniref:ArpU family phage packaging/lysis transcriptional regulator n=1 Tax=Lactobacillus TaxID=1578 RepID=UPI000CD9718D|nr:MULTISPECIES: ArpU family phage packaging/lysis transcriptional regulator [Lactobacillus]RVU73602.1 hypothetical protein EJK20_07310 [Lactobacillus xujianguonis]